MQLHKTATSNDRRTRFDHQPLCQTSEVHSLFGDYSSVTNVPAVQFISELAYFGLSWLFQERERKISANALTWPA